ncbi:MAG: hypothetical protein O2917_00075 [Acidobacteria bacterium]|nr:hypothetical protein [Acidobacteriota bacterium]
MPAGRRAHNLLVVAFYALVAIAVTWPLVTVVDVEIAWDLGDPAFNSWVLLWTGGQVLAFLSGDLSALNRFWHGNIFYPERLTVAFSEHMVPQMLQALPVLAATDNVVLAYNLLFLSTFVLSGLGAFLLVRELTGSTAAGVVAGLAFAFAPYRLSQFSHLQVLSAQWMPFVLYGYRRYFETGRMRPLIGGTVALVLQNLSCGYYLLFFAPFVGLYVIYEMASRGRLREWTLWRTWMVTGAIALAATYPFLAPYFDVRAHTDVGVRTAEEIALFSADTHALVTPSPASWFWAERLPGYQKAEGEGFPGLTIVILAALGVAVGLTHRRRQTHDAHRPFTRPWRHVLVGMLAAWWSISLIAALIFLVTGGLPLPVDGVWAVHRQANGVLVGLLVLTMLLVVVSPGVRRYLHDVSGSLVGFFAMATVLASLLALGPQITVAGHVIGTGPYAWLVAYVPGFDGVRVPARFFMLVALFLACLAGFGVAALVRWQPRLAAGVVVVAGVLILAEFWAGPFQKNVRLAADGHQATPRDLHTGAALPPIYKVIRDEPDPVVLVEFPFGPHAWDLQAMFYAGYHRRLLVNGYSGFFPQSQRVRALVWSKIDSDPDAAWRAMVSARATHVLVHEDGFIPSQRSIVVDWLLAHGAVELLRDGTDRLFRVR